MISYEYALHLLRRTTLSADGIQTLRHFPPLFNSIEGITLVESSENLREMQSKRLCPPDAALEYDADIAGYQSTSKYSANIPITWTSETRYVPNGMYMCYSSRGISLDWPVR
jgi:hypothetical protein